MTRQELALNIQNGVTPARDIVRALHERMEECAEPERDPALRLMVQQLALVFNTRALDDGGTYARVMVECMNVRDGTHRQQRISKGDLVRLKGAAETAQVQMVLPGKCIATDHKIGGSDVWQVGDLEKVEEKQ